MEGCANKLFFLKSLLQVFSNSTGLRVNYAKSMMIPINIEGDKLSLLAQTFGCSVGTLPFTYFGLPLGRTKPNVEEFLPLISRCERGLISTSNYHSQAGRLQMTNTVFSLTTVYLSTFKLHRTVIKQIDQFKKHCLWRGADLTTKTPPKVAWEMDCLPESEGGLGISQLSSHNEVLLLKNLHKLFIKADIPWVHLLWEKYYPNGKLPNQTMNGSFWWRDT
jgi:hypothetical protein